MNGSIAVKLITLGHYQMQVAPTLGSSLGQRLRSADDGHRSQ